MPCEVCLLQGSLEHTGTDTLHHTHTITPALASKEVPDLLCKLRASAHSTRVVTSLLTRWCHCTQRDNPGHLAHPVVTDIAVHYPKGHGERSIPVHYRTCTRKDLACG